MLIYTKSGPICGLKKKSKLGTEYFSFQGVPFAKPPVGDERRFKAPVPVEPWTETLNAFEEKPVPYHLHSNIGPLEQNEDCLYLNIYSKKNDDTKKLPVLVFIYGGGFTTGSSTSKQYGYDFLAEENVVLVTFNYRLSVFGCLSFKDSTIGIPGNAFLKDQRLALKWIKENIDAFGGNAENITVLGHSAGACSIHYHLLSPGSEGLFNRATVMNGSALAKYALIPHYGAGEILAKNTGWNGENGERGAYEHLLSLDAETLNNASNPNSLLFGEKFLVEINLAFEPVIEPYESEDSFCTKHPKKLVQTAWSNSTEVIFWNSSNEAGFQYGLIKKLASLGSIPDNLLLPQKTIKKLNAENLNEAFDKIKTIYKTETFSEDNLQPAFSLANHQVLFYPTHKSIQARVKYATAKTYLAYFNIVSETLNHHKHLIYKCSKEKGAVHGDELSFIFSNNFQEISNKDSAEYRNIRKLVNFLVGFAAEGSKKCDELGWKAITMNDFPDTYEAMMIEDLDWKMRRLSEISTITVLDELYS